jgi:hypothetical protein
VILAFDEDLLELIEEQNGPGGEIGASPEASSASCSEGER